MRTIVAATDFSQGASSAIDRAALLAAEHGATLEIVHVAEPPSSRMLSWLGLGGVAAHDDAGAQQRLDVTVERARTRGAAVQGRVLVGDPVTKIEDYRTDIQADLLVIGAHGQGQSVLHEAVFGTTAERLMERGGCDTLVVKETPAESYSHILVCVALAPSSHRVVTATAELSHDAALHVLHAYEVPFERLLHSYDVHKEDLERLNQRARQEAYKEVSAIIRDTISNEERARIVLREGYPSKVILHAADSFGCDLIAVGRSGSPARQLFLGSVTKHVVRGSTSDILVVAA